MENDLISRSAVLDALREAEFQHWHPLDEIDGVIDAIPSIDAVPVVRCRECAIRCTITCPMCDSDINYDIYGMPTSVPIDYAIDDGYCWRGERKDMRSD